MDVFSAIADERRGMADLLSGLTDEQFRTQSLCSGWSVQEVAAHLVVPLEVSTPRFVLAIMGAGGSFDRANTRLARQHGQRPVGDLVEVLRRRAGSRWTPPGAGPEAPLTDLLVHGLDIRWPLQLSRRLPAERACASLTFLTTRAGRGLTPKGALDGLRFEAEDVDWSHGDGPAVRGSAESVLLAMTGRTVALDHLTGEGSATLRARLA
ncbi:maleylpyruvate isomerase family mycothiol-dependent enzyme [Auraticoccus monumenti]|uniref:TIGR03083 family protein n=1 Tax=Auraticoccus monumenti TaxID=675864 RepID=A0A1G7A0L0_9ACTN|nr:maleylpyruvate isomerase family mycothiol-dependent enzyme [Auraticoccus monumenti]SDE07436.1 TIGR03083 family protein [Auraticoccus monumenti]